MKYVLLFRFLVLFAASTLPVFAGCGYDNGLNLARVQGRVTFKGEHVKKGTVFFLPDEGKGTVGPSAVGTLRDDGTYIASTDYAGDGVIIGSHKIGLTGMEAAAADDVAAAPDAEKDSAEFIQAKVKATRKRMLLRKDWICSPTAPVKSGATSSPRGSVTQTNRESSPRSSAVQTL